MDSGGGFLGCWEAGRLVRHESRRRSMARVAADLSVEDLEAGFRSAEDPTATRHFQVSWLLARGHTACQQGSSQRPGLLSWHSVYSAGVADTIGCFGAPATAAAASVS